MFASGKMLQSSFSFSFLQVLLATSVLAQNETEKLPGFGDSVQILGAMERTDQDFADGLALDLFSPKNRTLVVKQNQTPLSAKFITGSTGEPFVALSNYSYVISMNETANDLIAKIEIPYDPTVLAGMGIQEANTYVGTLAPDGKSWVISENTRNVHRSENNTRIIKMTSMAGEYLLVGRQTVDTANIFVQYGQGETRTANFTAGASGGGGSKQAVEFVDGLRFEVQADKDVRMNVDLKAGIAGKAVPEGATSLNSYSWVVNTSDTNVGVRADMVVPFNRAMLNALVANSTTAKLTVGKRALNATTGVFVAMNSQQVNPAAGDLIVVPGMTQLDGEYIILVS